MKIKPLIGYGHIKLGITQDEALKLLGEPDEVELMDMTGSESSLWMYDELEIELDFSSEYNYRLHDIDIFSTKAELKGVFPVGMNEEDLCSEFPSMQKKFGTCRIHDEFEMMFWLDETNKVHKATVYPYRSPEDYSNIVWPL